MNTSGASPFSLLTLDHAAVGRPLTRCGVSLFPIYTHGPQLDIATGPGSGVVISEQQSAQVPTLLADNPTDRLALLVAGETVVGGKQNRVLNVSVLIVAKGQVLVPVSCVEQGRWQEGGDFRRGSSFATRRVRRAKVATVAESVRQHGNKFADQGEVWNVVGSELHRLNAYSNSSALSALDDHIESDNRVGTAIAELETFGPLPGQCGVVVAHGERVLSAEIFASPTMLASHWAALTRGMLLDAPTDAPSRRPSATQVLKFLRRIATSAPTITDGVGLGQEHHVRTNRLVAQALVVDQAIVHASAFALAA
ncbi:hypothetical protein BH10ACT2_BH10ACT2_18990 [soil metagenome]